MRTLLSQRTVKNFKFNMTTYITMNRVACVLPDLVLYTECMTINI